MKKSLVILALTAGSLSIAGVVALRSRPEVAHSVPPTSIERVSQVLEAGQPIQPVPATATLEPRRVALGKELFNDVRLSKDDTISCASCHDLEHGGADGRRVSTGVDGSQGSINSPTVLNAVLNFKQFWDGRADTLEEQIEGPVTHPKEMGSTWSDVVRKLDRDAAFAQRFREVYSDGITSANIKDAIATFERSLLTPHSRFDRFLQGDKDALTSEERQGYELFLEVGCVTCHQGGNIGGNSFQAFGIKSNYFEDRGDITQADLGRFNVTGKERDRYKFKVPTLRNVSKTAPYFHDGSVATLEEAVQIMARYQLGQKLEDGECQQIVAFLRALDGVYTP